MFAEFDKIFNPTKEDINKYNKAYEECKKNMPKKSEIKLIKHDKYDFLYYSENLIDFDEECLSCRNYKNSDNDVTIDQGYCKLHKCNCGYGFTCDDFFKS